MQEHDVEHDLRLVGLDGLDVDNHRLVVPGGWKQPCLQPWLEISTLCS